METSTRAVSVRTILPPTSLLMGSPISTRRLSALPGAAARCQNAKHEGKQHPLQGPDHDWDRRWRATGLLTIRFANGSDFFRPASARWLARYSDPGGSTMRRILSRPVMSDACSKAEGLGIGWALVGVLLLSGPCQAVAAEAQAPLAATAAAKRPIVGLVLGGGGARGAAHIGVLEVLERLRVKVDCVAGTSMGALVAGAWAAGLSPRQMRDELSRADWGDLFLDNPGQEDLRYRSKQLSARFLPASETGIRDGGINAQPGVVEGQKIKLFFNRLVQAERGEPELQNLPLPVSMIATDIGTGERVVYRDGSLTQAMRASMSVPGLMAPLEYRARKLVDGGLVDNLPVREVRDRCGAQVVIAVNVGSPPAPAESVTGLLSITAQVIVLLS